MNTARPLYGLSHVYHADFLDEQPERIEDLAAEYLSEVRMVQAHGPYHFCGFSAGGMIAFEMARQLLEQGETVETLILAEPTLPPQTDRVSHLKNSMKQSPSKIRFFLALIKRAPKSIAARTVFLTRKLTAWALLKIGRPLPEDLRWLGYLRLLGPAQKRYTYSPIDCGAKILYQDMDEQSYENTANYWDWIFKQGSEVICFPEVSDHNDFMQEPAMTKFVALVEQRNS